MPQGNIILTDEACNIMSVLRVVQPNEEQRIAVHEVYNTALAQEHTPVTEAALRSCLEAGAAAGDVLKKALSTLGPARPRSQRERSTSQRG